MTTAPPIPRRRNDRRARRRTAGLFAVAAIVLLTAGCTPRIDFDAETVVEESGILRRRVVVECVPHAGAPKDRIRLSDYLRLPEADAYDHWKADRLRAEFSGVFANDAELPVDLEKITPDTELRAQNRVQVRRKDYLLVHVYEYEEQLVDIVERTEGEEGLEEASGLLVETLIAGLRNRFGADYDLSEFEDYLREILPELAQRLYHVYWEVRRAERNRFSEPEETEWDRRARQQLSRFGVYLPSRRSARGRPSRSDILWAFLDGKLRQMVTPRRKDVPVLTAEAFRGAAAQARLLAAVEDAVKESFGSREDFEDRIRPLLPVVFGAFSGWSLSIPQTEPSLVYSLRVKLPGRIIEANGMIDLDGSVRWVRGTRDLTLTGAHMWARSLLPDEEMLEKLDLRDFPGDIDTMQRYFRALCAGGPNPHHRMVKTLQICVASESLSPLDRMAERSVLPAPEMGRDDSDEAKALADAAGEMREILSAFRPDTSPPRPAARIISVREVPESRNGKDEGEDDE